MTGPALDATAAEGLLFGLLVLPICAWVAYTDLSAMRIRNEAVLALLAAFVVTGPFVLAPDAYLWRYAQLALVLALGFALSSARLLGAGDAKFAAAAAPMVAPGDAGTVMMLLATLLAATLALHRAARAIPKVRGLAPHWRSWHEARDFPLGVPLGLTLAAYLWLAALG